jgi:hypothetical protein
MNSAMGNHNEDWFQTQILKGERWMSLSVWSEWVSLVSWYCLSSVECLLLYFMFVLRQFIALHDICFRSLKLQLIEGEEKRARIGEGMGWRWKAGTGTFVEGKQKLIGGIKYPGFDFDWLPGKKEEFHRCPLVSFVNVEVWWIRSLLSVSESRNSELTLTSVFDIEASKCFVEA